MKVFAKQVKKIFKKVLLFECFHDREVSRKTSPESFHPFQLHSVLGRIVIIVSSALRQIWQICIHIFDFEGNCLLFEKGSLFVMKVVGELVLGYLLPRVNCQNRVLIKAQQIVWRVGSRRTEDETLVVIACHTSIASSSNAPTNHDLFRRRHEGGEFDFFDKWFHHVMWRTILLKTMKILRKADTGRTVNESFFQPMHLTR